MNISRGIWSCIGIGKIVYSLVLTAKRKNDLNTELSKLLDVPLSRAFF
jgi:hypothetical protein